MWDPVWMIAAVEDDRELRPSDVPRDDRLCHVYLAVGHLAVAPVAIHLDPAKDHEASHRFGEIFGGSLLFRWLGWFLRFCLLGRRLGDESLQELALSELMANREPMVLARRVHQLLELVATVLRRRPWRLIRGGDLLIAPGAVVSPASIRVFSSLLLLTAWFACIAWALSFAEDCPYHILSINEFGCYVKEVGGGPWLPASELMDECLVGGAIGEGAHHVGVCGIRKFVSLLGESPDVVSEAFPALLDASLEVPRTLRALVGALEISNEGFFEVNPVVDCSFRQMLKPSSCPLLRGGRGGIG